MKLSFVVQLLPVIHFMAQAKRTKKIRENRSVSEEREGWELSLVSLHFAFNQMGFVVGLVVPNLTLE